MESQLDWCIDTMIARNSITLICAESGTGKTWVGYFIAGRVAHGMPVLGLRVTGSKVLYLDGENPLCSREAAFVRPGNFAIPPISLYGVDGTIRRPWGRRTRW